MKKNPETRDETQYDDNQQKQKKYKTKQNKTKHITQKTS